MITDVIDNILGYGPIQVVLDDPDVTEVMVNNPDTSSSSAPADPHDGQALHRRGPPDADHRQDRCRQVGRRIDESSPMVDARLPDGSRVNAIIHPLAINGPMLTIRKFSKDPYTVDDLIAFGTMNERAAEFLDACVRGRLNILISGGTGTGKTTLLNVVSAVVPTTSASSPSRTRRSYDCTRSTCCGWSPGRRTSKARDR